MSSLQLALIAAGVVLVVGVIIYNWLAERRVRRKISEAFRAPDTSARDSAAPAAASVSDARVEPSLHAPRGSSLVRESVARPDVAGDVEGYEPPLAIHARIASDLEQGESQPALEARAARAPPAGVPQATLSAQQAPMGDRSAPQPDPDIECIVTLQPVKPVAAGAVAAGLHARLGRPLRWFGRRTQALPWQLLRSDSTGEFSEIAACLLLANRAGAASAPLLDQFFRIVNEIAPTLPAAVVAPDATTEASRAEALDRICADLDMQIGITVLKEAAPIAGTRLRGIAEASGFKLADSGRFDWVQEETGAVLYSLQNYRPEPFTMEMLRQTSTPGAVFLLDVPRVAEPVRVFDQMRLAAKRMAQTLEATLVDDNRRKIDDAALNSIREQVRASVAALREVNIEPGSARALALFGG